MKSSVARFAYVVVFILVAAYALVTLRGPRGVHALVEKQAQIQEQEKRNAELTRDLERERERIKRLTDNPADQDLEIRERLKLVHPGEKVYITGPQ
ncbi:Septum formation initiator [Candidatus Sulfopaludibacter sp. SbA4]|nr:Septum formation initiator [Candidatus Sulfopaludibacter sp. SbA4]